MGKFYHSRGIVQALRSFKKFEQKDQNAKAKLVFKIFSKRAQKDLASIIGTSIEIHV